MEILVICRHPEILQTIVRLVNTNPDWHAIGAISDQEAISAFNTGYFEMVLLGSGIDEAAEAELSAAFTSAQPGIIIIQHYGGGSGLLTAEIYEAQAGRCTGNY